MACPCTLPSRASSKARRSLVFALAPASNKAEKKTGSDTSMSQAPPATTPSQLRGTPPQQQLGSPRPESPFVILPQHCRDETLEERLEREHQNMLKRRGKREVTIVRKVHELVLDTKCAVYVAIHHPDENVWVTYDSAPSETWDPSPVAVVRDVIVSLGVVSG